MPVSLEQLLFLHVVVSGEFRTAEGVRDRAALEAALARPVATFAGELLYGSPFARAAALLESIIEGRPFAGGNRAVALMAAAFWLEREGYGLEAEPEQLTQLTVASAVGALDVDRLAARLEEYAKPLVG
ncbi:MAG TPA: Fic family protein [Chloroflexota bacterium]|nr:Fic family protein [Chloroflexota bacterium]